MDTGLIIAIVALALIALAVVLFLSRTRAVRGSSTPAVSRHGKSGARHT